MNRLRPFCALILVILAAPAIGAADKTASSEKPASPWAVDRSLNISPQAAAAPLLQYRLLPTRWDLKEGNAVPIYLRLVHEQSDASRNYWAETPKSWNVLPVDKIPLADARKFLEGQRYFLRQLELGARRRTAEWNYTLDEGNPIGILLPDAQSMRTYAPMMILQVRVAIAAGNFRAAAHHLATGFAFSRHVAEGPFLVNSMVAFALETQFAGAVADLIERPDAPNLYWALAAMPRPLFDLRDNMEREYGILEWQIPEMGDLERERTTEQWDGVLRRVRTELRHFSQGLEEGKFFPKGCAPEEPAANSADLPAAREFVARMKGLSASQVAAMPPAKVLLLYMQGTWHEDRDDWYRGAYLPYPQAWPLFAAATNRLRESPITEGHAAPRLLLPALNNVVSTQARVERHLAALRVIEALRIYAAAHDGKLPVRLAEVTEVPVPDDPGTGKTFEYHREGVTATLLSQVPDDPRSNNGVRFRVSMRKK